MKDITHLTIIDKKMRVDDYIEDVTSILSARITRTSDFVGVKYVPSEFDENYVIGFQLMNTQLVPNIREPSIGTFINENPEFIKRALQYDDFIYEQKLEWIEEQTGTTRDIKPDLLFLRNDGFYDICDLKKPLLDKRKLTRGRRERRLFIQEVTTALAQLAHYEAYFTHLENRKYAKDTYNIEVKNPKLILIIGNYENFTREEVDEALRPYQNDKFMIIDYDTLYARFRASAGVHIQESRKLGLNLEIR